MGCYRQLTYIEAILVGGAEIYRNTEQNIERRQYPGGVFDPLGLASEDSERTFNLKTAELKHGVPSQGSYSILELYRALSRHTAALCKRKLFPLAVSTTAELFGHWQLLVCLPKT